MDFKTGILVMLVGIAILGMTTSSVSANQDRCIELHYNGQLYGKYCDVDTGSACKCSNIEYENSWYISWEYNVCYNYTGYQWCTANGCPDW